jgi:hypothetical protein
MLSSRRLLCSILTSLLLFAFLPTSALAQSEEDSGGDDGLTSLTVGYLANDFDYLGGPAGGNPFAFDKNLRSLKLSTRHGSLLLDYERFGGEANKRRTFGAELLTGGNSYLFREFLHLPIGIYVPIRVNLDYRYVEPRNPERNNLHFGAAGLGAGAGARLRLPIGPDFLKENFEARLTGVFVPAVMMGISDIEAPSAEDPGAGLVGEDTFDDTRLRRMFDINLDIELAEILSDNVGITAGYTFRIYGHSAGPPSSAVDYLDAVTLTGTYTQTSAQNVVRVGINW